MSERVTLPLNVYYAMASCYFGNGPRHHENRTPPSPQREGEDGLDSSEEIVQQVIRAAPPELQVEEWVPKGVAAKTVE